jgi:PAS domain S-box-containing protein
VLIAKELSTAILESLPDGIVALDDAHRAVMANEAIVSLMGWHGSPVVGEAASDLFGAWPELAAILRDWFGGARSARPTDLARHLPEGRLQHLRVTTAPLAVGDAEGVVVAVRDVSELKRMEWEVFQAEKMSALGRLAASVAHEVRNPLSAIDIQMQLMSEDIGGLEDALRDRLDRRLNVARAEMKRLDRIVHNFLRFSRTPKLRLQPVGINEVVRHVFELVTPEAREQGVQLHLDLGEPLPTVEGDDSQLGQAILNMIVNAFQAIEDGGSVRATTRFDEGSAHVCLALTDSGTGIPEQEIDRIFEFYYTTKDEGTGLGLSIAQRIAYQHGGFIEVESRESEGSTFRLNLPVAPNRQS